MEVTLPSYPIKEEGGRFAPVVVVPNCCPIQEGGRFAGRKAEKDTEHFYFLVPRINWKANRWKFLCGEKPKKVQPSSGRKAEKGTERFYFLVPRIREKPNRWKFLLYEGPQKRVHKQTTFLVFGGEHPVMNIRRRDWEVVLFLIQSYGRETLMSFKVKQWGYASGDRSTTVVNDFV